MESKKKRLSPSGFELPPDFPLIPGGILVQYNDLEAFLGDVGPSRLKARLGQVRSSLGLRRGQAMNIYEYAKAEGWDPMDTVAILYKWRCKIMKIA